MLTEKQYKLLAYINKLKSKSGIHALVSSLEERNFIRRLPHKARALEVIHMPRFKPQAILEEEKKREQALQCSSVEIPLYGKIAAGTPIEALADENEKIAVPFNMVAVGQYYALKIEGNSMIEAGIMDGDTAIIRRQDQADNGKIVVALVDDAEATLKILKKQGESVKLIPCNKDYEIREFTADRVKIQGVLSGIIRNY